MTTRFRTCCRFSSIFLLLCCLAAMAAAVEVPFLTEHTVENTQRSDWLDSGDVDGDGDPDLVTANCDGDTFSLWRNDGGATSWTQVVIDSTSTDCPRMIRFVDLDADGDLDAIGAASNSNGSVHWFENDLGDGSSWTAHSVTTNTGPAYWSEAADMDRDGDLDLTVALGDRISWWSNDGGSWTEHEVATGFDDSRSASPADVDGDGDLDLIGTSFKDDEILWWSNDGACTPGCSWAATTIGILDEANTVATADMDGDGDLDVVAAGHASGIIGWWENTAGTGAAWTAHALSTTEPLSWAVAAADLDDDGDLDVVGTSIADNDLTWWENDGSACDPDCSWPERDLDDSFLWAEAVVIDDLDRDGDLDVVGGSQGAGIAWWENETLHRSAAFDEGVEIITIDRPSLLAAGDLDRDGDLDLVTSGDTALVWSENDGTGLGWTNRTIASGLGGANGVTVEDADGDGDLDVLLADGGSSDVLWFENDGSPADGGWTSHTVDGDWGSPLWAQPADLDQDGDPDIVSVRVSAEDVVWYENDGTPGTGTWLRRTIGAGLVSPQAAEVGDVDGDGDLDVIATSIGDALVAWFESDGSPADGGWVEHAIVTGFSGAFGARLCDLDGDGDLDLAATGQSQSELRWFENDGTPGDGLWTPHVVDGTFSGGAFPDCLDFDDDGDLDLVVPSVSINTVSFFANDGTPADGGWQRQDLVTGFAVAASAIGVDLDSDGRPDAVASAFSGDRVESWRNIGGQFALPTEDAVSETILDEGATDVPLLRIDGMHRGRTGDDDAEIATLDLLFEEDAADPLTGSELDALVDTLRLYLDDGDDAFDPGLDTAFFSLGSPFTLTDGVLTVTLVDDDPNAQFAVGAGKTYFLAADIAADAGSATPERFQVTHLTSASSTGEMASTDIPLRLEPSADVTSTHVEINDPPELTSPIDDQAAVVDVNFELDVSTNFSDPEGQALSFSAAGLPATLGISPDGMISGTPSVGDIAGSPYTVTVTAADPNGATDSDTFSLIVRPTDIFADGFESGDVSAWSSSVP